MAGALVAAVSPSSGLTRNGCRLAREEIGLVLPYPSRVFLSDETSVLVPLGDTHVPPWRHSSPLWPSPAGAGCRLGLPESSIAGGHLAGTVHRQASGNISSGCMRLCGDGKVREEDARSVYPFQQREHRRGPSDISPLYLYAGAGSWGEGDKDRMLCDLQPPHFACIAPGPGRGACLLRFEKSSRMPSTKVLS